MGIRNLNYKKEDELYTPKILVEPIIQYLDPKWIIWCPFDTDKSEFVLILKEKGFNVIHSHIEEGKDFFKYEPEYFDCVISNPPYSLKLKILERLYSFNKPFGIILGLPILNYQIMGNFFIDKNLQLLIVDKKVSFNGKTASFNSSYFCNNLLPNDLIFTHLENNNSGKYYIPSRMYDK